MLAPIDAAVIKYRISTCFLALIYVFLKCTAQQQPQSAEIVITNIPCNANAQQLLPTPDNSAMHYMQCGSTGTYWIIPCLVGTTFNRELQACVMALTGDAQQISPNLLGSNLLSTVQQQLQQQMMMPNFANSAQQINPNPIAIQPNHNVFPPAQTVAQKIQPADMQNVMAINQQPLNPIQISNQIAQHAAQQLPQIPPRFVQSSQQSFQPFPIETQELLQQTQQQQQQQLTQQQQLPKSPLEWPVTVMAQPQLPQSQMNSSNFANFANNNQQILVPIVNSQPLPFSPQNFQPQAAPFQPAHFNSQSLQQQNFLTPQSSVQFPPPPQPQTNESRPLQQTSWPANAAQLTHKFPAASNVNPFQPRQPAVANPFMFPFYPGSVIVSPKLVTQTQTSSGSNIIFPDGELEKFKKNVIAASNVDAAMQNVGQPHAQQSLSNAGAEGNSFSPKGNLSQNSNAALVALGNTASLNNFESNQAAATFGSGEQTASTTPVETDRVDRANFLYLSDKCQENRKCQHSATNQLFCPDFTDRNKYYICAPDGWVSQKCPNQLHFAGAHCDTVEFAEEYMRTHLSASPHLLAYLDRTQTVQLPPDQPKFNFHQKTTIIDVNQQQNKTENQWEGMTVIQPLDISQLSSSLIEFTRRINNKEAIGAERTASKNNITNHIDSTNDGTESNLPGNTDKVTPTTNAITPSKWSNLPNNSSEAEKQTSNQVEVWSPTVGSFCSLFAKPKNKVWPNPHNKTQFFLCQLSRTENNGTDGRWVALNCPTGTVFDPFLNVCDSRLIMQTSKLNVTNAREKGER